MKREFITEKKKKLIIAIDENNKTNVKANWNENPVRVKLFDKDEIRNFASDPAAFKNNIKNKVNQTPPFPWLIWPLDFFDGADGTFVYVTGLIPSEFVPLNQYMDGSKKFKNWSVIYAAAMELVWMFHSLHTQGYSFLNMTNEDILIDANTGKVVLTGIEWLEDQKEADHLKINKSSVLVHPLYYLGKKNTDLITDEYILSVLLFEILCQQHPLEGHNIARCPVLNDEYLKKFYGTDPLFIFDQENDSNRPVKGVHLMVTGLWNRCPESIKKKFYREFSHSVMTDNVRGISVASWYETLDHVRSSVYTVPGGAEKILLESAGKKPKSKEERQKEAEEIAPLSWEIGEGNTEQRFFLIPGNKIYTSQLNFPILSDPSEIAGEIARGENTKLCYILNKTGEQWKVQYEDTQFSVTPGETILVKAGMLVQIGKNKIRIRETKVTG